MEQTRRTRKKEQTHLAIMHSAKVQFEQEGLGNVTIEQIAEGADVSRSTFFSHFDSLDTLLSEIAAQEINDLFSAIEDEPSIEALFKQLNADTYPYPKLMTQLFIHSLLDSGKSAVARLDELLKKEIARGGYPRLRESFSEKDISAFILGSYFGLIFQKFMNDEAFENPNETNDKIQKLIKIFKEDTQ